MAWKKSTILKGAGGVAGLGGSIVGALYLLQPTESPEKQVNLPKEEPRQGQKAPVVMQPVQRASNIREALKNANLKLLNTKVDDNTDKERWEKLIAKFNSRDLSQDQKISAFVTITTDRNRDIVANIANMKAACDKLFETKREGEDEFVKNEELATNWCTEQSKFLEEQAQ